MASGVEPNHDQALQIEPDQEEAVLRVTSFYRRSFDRQVTRFHPLKHAPVRQSLAQPFPAMPTSPIGGMERLPVELTTEICQYLDIQSCLRLRQVNRLAREVVSSLPGYQAVATHGMDTLHAALRTGVATRLNISDLYNVLCTMECAICGAFGGFIYLPTVTRCCFSCLRRCPESLSTVTIFALSQISGVSSNRLARLLPALHTIPGNYTHTGQFFKARRHVVNRLAALDTLRSLGLGNGVTAHREASKDCAFRFMSSTPLPYFDRATGQVDRGISCKGCQLALERRMKYYWVYMNHDAPNEAFTKRGFLDHFHACPEAKKLWIASHGGTVAIEEPDATRPGEFMSELDSDGNPRED